MVGVEVMGDDEAEDEEDGKNEDDTPVTKRASASIKASKVSAKSSAKASAQGSKAASASSAPPSKPSQGKRKQEHCWKPKQDLRNRKLMHW